VDPAISITPLRKPISTWTAGSAFEKSGNERQTKLILDVAVLQPKNRLDLELMRANKAGNPQTGAAGRTSHKTVLFGKG
jgi:hypothetical protein